MKLRRVAARLLIHPATTQEPIMTKSQIQALQYLCLQHENRATTVERRKFWSAQFKRLTRLARRIGWID